MKSVEEGHQLLKALERQEIEMWKHHPHEREAINIIEAQVDIARWFMDMELIE